MRILLDTHALLWWFSGDRKLSRKVRALIEQEENEVLVSAASAWEITTKYRLGRLPDAEAIALDFDRQIVLQGFTPLNITPAHGQRAGLLSGNLRDPFDRMLIAQASAENVALVSVETVFDDYGVTRLW